MAHRVSLARRDVGCVAWSWWAAFLQQSKASREFKTILKADLRSFLVIAQDSPILSKTSIMYIVWWTPEIWRNGDTWDIYSHTVHHQGTPSRKEICSTLLEIESGSAYHSWWNIGINATLLTVCYINSLLPTADFMHSPPWSQAHVFEVCTCSSSTTANMGMLTIHLA